MEFWITRSRNGSLYLSDREPKVEEGSVMLDTSGNTYVIDEALFAMEVTFENSPQRVELKLIEE